MRVKIFEFFQQTIDLILVFGFSANNSDLKSRRRRALEPENSVNVTWSNKGLSFSQSLISFRVQMETRAQYSTTQPAAHLRWSQITAMISDFFQTLAHRSFGKAGSI